MAKAILNDGEPIVFVSECLLWMRASKEHEEDRIFTKEEEAHLGGIVASRIEEMSKKESILLSFPKGGSRLLSIWFLFFLLPLL